MIVFERLLHAYDNGSFYSLQLEVGDLCHQGCIYCYMNALDTPVNTISDRQITRILKDAHALGITAIEWLGGEPLLRGSIFAHMAECAEFGMRNNVWTGGLPLENHDVLKKTAQYAKHGLISVHVSTVDPSLYKLLHPGRSKRDLELILDKIQDLIDIGYPPSQLLNSVTFTGLQSAEDMIETMNYFEQEFGIKTSLNVYHTYLRPGVSKKELKRFIPSTDEVRKLYSRYALQWGVKDYPMNCVNKQYCSATLAVLCDGSVTPCATIREKHAPNLHFAHSLYDIVQENSGHLSFYEFRDRNNIPEKCRKCELSELCFGCRSRSYAAGNGIYGMDPRCFR